jgi:hypothetical protein
MRYKILVRRGPLAIGTGLAMLAAMTCLAAAPAQPGTVEAVLSPPPPTATAAPATPAGLPKEPKQIQAIRLAGSPSEAAHAYAEAIKVNDKDPATYDTYIRRMMGFALTEILGAPAQALVKLDPNNGLGWAVLGFSLARQGNMPAAFDDAVKALNASPKDPFVLQFAGQLAGWYSHQAGQEGLPQSILQAVLKLREFAAQPAYIQGYTAASNAIQGPAQAAPATAAANPQNPGVDGTYYSSDNTQAAQAPSADTGTYYSYTESPTYYTSNYTSNYATPNYSAYDQGYAMPYGSTYYGGYYGGFGFGPSFIVGSPLFFGHHRFFDHDADDHMGRGTRTASNSLFFNSGATGALARQRDLAGATGVTGKTGVVTQSSRLNSAAMVGQPARTPAFSTFNGSTARWNSMSKGAAAPVMVPRWNSAGTAVPHATFSAPASSFRAAPAHFSVSPSFGGGGAAHFSGGGVSHSSGGGGGHGGRR